ncbi:hypothetical protein [Raoultella ornithinolytica]|uniref:hypothetical protein n=1 Tax=Raoultella ornithinolytica TaxID=54291 RepID=UPI00113FDB20|nr:hypothetical protein [Raoultella ornithinolytica]MCE9800170.1 hypothetical protein [Raoultella ornithinolytica]MCE9813922.1 hypothetical protein [Raoultella ornithinolytica]MCE9868097.1 hypothetical protein [Raoultella ornithinolytica]HCL6647412.1 hypothetical protein [Raoultella ornithinolytica]HEC2616323.1 hypothetical protein [Raoultella ornithinolytica]
MYTLSVPGWRSEATGAARKPARRHVERQKGLQAAKIKLCSPQEQPSCILLTLIKVLSKKAAVLYKAAAIAVKFRTILK